MRFEALTNRVEVMVRLRKETNRVMDDVYVRFAVDQYGHVEVDLPHRADENSFERHERYRQQLDILIEEFGVAEWQRVGPEDSEPFLTAEWMERTQDQRATLGAGWQDLPLPEGLVLDDETQAS